MKKECKNTLEIGGIISNGENMEYLFFSKENFTKDIFENVIAKSFFSTSKMSIPFKLVDRFTPTQCNVSRIFMNIFSEFKIYMKMKRFIIAKAILQNKIIGIIIT